MFIIPLTNRKSRVDTAISQNDIFDLFFKDDGYYKLAIIINVSTVTVVGAGTVDGAVALQVHSRKWENGHELSNPKPLGNQGFMGDYSNFDEVIKRLCQKEDSYALDIGRVVQYTGQSLGAVDSHWNYIEPIMAVLSRRNPREEFSYFLRTLRYDNEKKFNFSGGLWKLGMLFFIDDREVSFEEWYYEFACITIGEKNNGGCYVATYVYGSYDCPQVWVLRRFRDYYLAKTVWGRFFIRFYYFVSPKMIRLFGNNNGFRSIWTIVLDSIVSKLREKGISSECYNDYER